jgi:hypothetical protein
MKAFIMTVLWLLPLATNASILCHTPRMNKVFEINENKVTFFNEFDSTAKRELASVVSRARSNQAGVTKIVDFENQKHTIYISNLNQFSEVDDYIIIKAKSGHEVTYPLTCEKR